MIRRLTEVIGELRDARSVLLDAELSKALSERAPSNGGGADGRRFATAALAFSQGLAQIERWGIVVRDLDSGICDFPAQRAGQDIYLCWKMGEERIEFWHPVDAGFAGRRPLDDEIAG